MRWCRCCDRFPDFHASLSRPVTCLGEYTGTTISGQRTDIPYTATDRSVGVRIQAETSGSSYPLVDSILAPIAFEWSAIADRVGGAGVFNNSKTNVRVDGYMTAPQLVDSFFAPQVASPTVLSLDSIMGYNASFEFEDSDITLDGWLRSVRIGYAQVTRNGTPVGTVQQVTSGPAFDLKGAPTLGVNFEKTYNGSDITTNRMDGASLAFSESLAVGDQLGVIVWPVVTHGGSDAGTFQNNYKFEISTFLGWTYSGDTNQNDLVSTSHLPSLLKVDGWTFRHKKPNWSIEWDSSSDSDFYSGLDDPERRSLSFKSPPGDWSMNQGDGIYRTSSPSCSWVFEVNIANELPRLFIYENTTAGQIRAMYVPAQDSDYPVGGIGQTSEFSQGGWQATGNMTFEIDSGPVGFVQQPPFPAAITLRRD